MSSEPQAELMYLELPDVLGLYADIFDLDERVAKGRLRNEEGLRSALNRPRTYAHYGKADIALQAAALGHAIAEGQHFLDGNKRVALVAMRTFLAINGYGVDVSQEERADWMLSLSAGVSVEALADRIRRALRIQPPASEED